MPTIDWDSVKSAKDQHRERLRAQSFGDKLKTLDKLREREAQLRKLRPGVSSAVSARSTFATLPGEDATAHAFTHAHFLPLGADVTFVTSVVARGAVSEGAAQTSAKPLK